MTPRFTTPAALGLVPVVVSTLLPWHLADGPIGPIERTELPVALWIGIIVAASAIVTARLRPDLERPAAKVAITASVGMGIVCWTQMTEGDVGAGPWLCLLGAVIIASAAATSVIWEPEDDDAETDVVTSATLTSFLREPERSEPPTDLDRP